MNVPTLTRILDRIPDLSQDDRDWLHQLTGDWQIIADLTFSDLILYVKYKGAPTVAAQVRPATAATVFEFDIVGMPADDSQWSSIRRVFGGGETPTLETDSNKVTFVPVRRPGARPIAVLAIVTAVVPDRVPSHAQLSYEDVAGDLVGMVATGDFPIDGAPTGYRHGTPRVSDGFIHVDADGDVVYASPNAVSNLRRLGVDETLTGSNLSEVVTRHIETHSQVDESLAVVLLGKAAWLAEVESRGIIVSLRTVPLKKDGRHIGAVILTRDITELRRQERQLITKDATIREINHRVKNNLQTVSALLRLQARRATNDETKDALENAQRRVSTIAIVHERLSETIDEVVEFDQLFVPLIRLIRDTAVTDKQVRTAFSGSFGRVRAEQATALAMALNEVITNAIEHGLPEGGNVEIDAERSGDQLNVTVTDDGTGMDESGPGSGLGTQIVRTMVEGELGGHIEWENVETGGTRVRITARLRS